MCEVHCKCCMYLSIMRILCAYRVCTMHTNYEAIARELNNIEDSWFGYYIIALMSM